MRVIAGSAKGRRLRSVQGMDTRPTTDRVKEALFSILNGRVNDAQFLDLYAGNGGIGIEALSRGAAKAIFIDKSPLCTQMIRTNLSIVNFFDRSEVYTNDVLRALSILGKRKLVFDIIFLDPPYHQDLIGKTLRLISEYELLASGGIVVVEHSKKEEITPEVLKLVRVRSEQYGDTVLGFYRHKEDSSENMCMSW